MTSGDTKSDAIKDERATPGGGKNGGLDWYRTWLKSNWEVERWVAAFALLVVTVWTLFLDAAINRFPPVSMLFIGGLAFPSALACMFILGQRRLYLPLGFIRHTMYWTMLVMASLMLGLGLLVAYWNLLFNVVSTSADRAFMDGVQAGIWLLIGVVWPVIVAWAGIRLYRRKLARLQLVDRSAFWLMLLSIGHFVLVFMSLFVAPGRYNNDDQVTSLLATSLPVFLFSGTIWLRTIWLRPRFREQIQQPICQHCQYDMSGSLAAGRETCPECGNHYKRFESYL